MCDCCCNYKDKFETLSKEVMAGIPTAEQFFKGAAVPAMVSQQLILLTRIASFIKQLRRWDKARSVQAFQHRLEDFKREVLYHPEIQSSFIHIIFR